VLAEVRRSSATQTIPFFSGVAVRRGQGEVDIKVIKNWDMSALVS
jgi:hypothetical protein